MQTYFDWLSVGLFCALTVLFLQRSVGPAPARDRIWHYIPPAVGCAAANYVGNQGNDAQNLQLQLFSGVLLVAVAIYILQVLRPFDAK